MEYERLKAYARLDGLAEGRAEGLEEGRAEGLEKGRTEGLEEGKAEGLKEGRTEGLKEGKLEAALKTAIIAVKEFNLDPETVAEKFGVDFITLKKALETKD